MTPLILSHGVSQRNNPRNQTRSKKAIKNQIKHIPEPNIKPSNLINLAKLITQEAQRKYIKDNLDEIKISSGINGVDCSRVET